MSLKMIMSTCMTWLLLSISLFASAKNPVSYQDILTEIKAGKEVSALIDVSKCEYMEKATNDNNIETAFMGVSIGHSFEIIKRDRFDGKRLFTLVADQQNWDGTHNTLFILERKLIRVWEDNLVDVFNDSIDPNTHKLIGRDRLLCKATPDGSGGVTFTSTNEVVS